MKNKVSIILTSLVISAIGYTSCNSGKSEYNLNYIIDSLSILDTHIHYEYYENNHKESLVFIHSSMLDSEMWRPQLDFFSKKYNLLLFDMPGHGRSGMRNATLLEHEYLEKLLSHLNINRVSVIGSSMGSVVATEFTLENPELVEKLILVSPTINGLETTDREFSIFVREYVNFMKTVNYPAAAESLCRISLTGPKRRFEHIDEKIRTTVFTKTLNHLNKGFWKESPYYLVPSSESRLNEIQTPSLLILGTEEFDYIKQTTSILSEKLRNVKLEYIEAAGQLSNLESPEHFNDLVEKFLDGQ